MTRILIFGIGFLCWTIFPERGALKTVNHRNENVDFEKVWNRFDSGWYVNLASNGYPQRPFNDSVEETWGFMPLYSMLMRLISAVSGLELFYSRCIT